MEAVAAFHESSARGPIASLSGACTGAARSTGRSNSLTYATV